MSKKIVLTKEQTLQLIKEVHQRPCLWNPDDEEYGRRYPVARAWANISRIMDNLPVMYLRIKWKCLRDAYKKELNKYPDTYSGTWRFFKPLKFLVFKSRNETEGSNESGNESSDREPEESSNQTTQPVVKCEPNLEWSGDFIPEKRRKLNDDGFDVLFLQSLTPYFKQLDPIRKLVIRSKMQDMLFNEISAQKSGTGPQYD